MRFRVTAFNLATFAALLLSTQVLSAEETIVELETSEGKIVLELDAEKAPKTVANFLEYVKDGHYEGTVFHRVIKGFMVQGGGMDTNLKEKSTKPPVRNEGGNGLSNLKYTVAMARTGDPHSATSQFFINTKDNGFLNRAQSRDGFGYTVFGKVIEGKEVVDKIESVKTGSRPDPSFPARLMNDVPAEPIVLKSAKLLQKQEN
ncbi:MAG: peptidylprolyl isomerase [Rubripirellula sp.]